MMVWRHAWNHLQRLRIYAYCAAMQLRARFLYCTTQQAAFCHQGRSPALTTPYSSAQGSLGAELADVAVECNDVGRLGLDAAQLVALLLQSHVGRTVPHSLHGMATY